MSWQNCYFEFAAVVAVESIVVNFDDDVVGVDSEYYFLLVLLQCSSKSPSSLEATCFGQVLDKKTKGEQIFDVDYFVAVVGQLFVVDVGENYYDSNSMMD